MAPGEVALTAAAAPSKAVFPTHAVRATFDSALDDFSGGIVKRQMTAKEAVRQPNHDVTRSFGLARLYRRLQQRIERGMAPDQ